MLSYNSKAITPAPIVTVSKTYVNNRDGSPLSTNYNLVLTGTLLPNRGSPNSSGEFTVAQALPDESFATDDDKFDSINRKQQALKDLFSIDGQTLEWMPAGGSSVKCYPHLVGIEFAKAQWVERSDYTITLRANRMFGPAGSGLEDGSDLLGEFTDYNLNSATDTWSVRETDDGSETITVTHTVTASAGDNFTNEGFATNTEAWQLAKAWVATRVSDTDNDFSSGADGENFLQVNSIFGLTFGAGSDEYQGYTRIRTENLDRLGGSYSLTEEWTLSKQNAVDLYTVRQSSDTADVSLTAALGYLNNFTISGTVRGLESGNQSTRYDNAKTYFEDNVKPNLATRIQDAIDAGTLNLSNPKNSSISRDVKNGIIQYEFSYGDDDIPAGISDIISSYNLTCNQEGGTGLVGLEPNVLAEIPIPGRDFGPIIQDMGTRPIVRRTIAGTIKLNKPASAERWIYEDDISTIRSAFNTLINNTNIKFVPTSFGSGNYWVTAFADTLDPINGLYNVSLTYTIKQTS